MVVPPQNFIDKLVDRVWSVCNEKGLSLADDTSESGTLHIFIRRVKMIQRDVRADPPHPGVTDKGRCPLNLSQKVKKGLKWNWVKLLVCYKNKQRLFYLFVFL